MGLCRPKSGSWLKSRRRENKGNCKQIGHLPCLLQPPPPLHMAVFGWYFTQLGWDYFKPPFVFLSIIMFALSWSDGFSSGKLFAAAPLPPTWLTCLFWYTRINIAATDMFSFLCCLSSLHSTSHLYTGTNSVHRKPETLKVHVEKLTINTFIF